jgi:hypothetical protein
MFDGQKHALNIPRSLITAAAAGAEAEVVAVAIAPAAAVAASEEDPVLLIANLSFPSQERTTLTDEAEVAAAKTDMKGIVVAQVAATQVGADAVPRTPGVAQDNSLVLAALANAVLIVIETTSANVIATPARLGASTTRIVDEAHACTSATYLRRRQSMTFDTYCKHTSEITCPRKTQRLHTFS